MNRFQTVQCEEKPVCKASFGHGLLIQICAQAIACMFTVDENVDCTICGIQRAKSLESRWVCQQNQDEMPKAAGMQIFAQV